MTDAETERGKAQNPLQAITRTSSPPGCQWDGEAEPELILCLPAGAWPWAHPGRSTQPRHIVPPPAGPLPTAGASQPGSSPLLRILPGFHSNRWWQLCGEVTGGK